MLLYRICIFILIPLSFTLAQDSSSDSTSLDVFDAKMEGSLTQWFTQGDFIMHGGPPTAGNTWELKHPVDSNLIMANLKFAYKDPILNPVWFNLALGWGAIEKGTIRDTDWDAAGVLQHLSCSTSKGTTKHFSFHFGYPIALAPVGQVEPDEGGKDEATRRRYQLDLMLGWRYLKNSADYHNPTVVVYNYAATNTSWSEHWLEYDLTYQGLEIGLQGNLNLGQVGLAARVGYVPYLTARYIGLRYPQQSPSNQRRERISADGYAFNAELKARINLAEHIDMALGYRYLKCETEGRDDPGTQWAGDWEELNTHFKGWFFGAEFQF